MNVECAQHSLSAVFHIWPTDYRPTCPICAAAALQATVADMEMLIIEGGRLEAQLSSAEARVKSAESDHAAVCAEWSAAMREIERLTDRVRELEGDKKFAERRLASAEQFIEWVESAADGKLPEKFNQDNATLIGEVFRMWQRLSRAEATVARLREVLEELTERRVVAGTVIIRHHGGGTHKEGEPIGSKPCVVCAALSPQEPPASAMKETP